MSKSYSSGLSSLLLSTVLATGLFAPAAHADAISAMVVNVRSADGVYRPALRIVRGGTVTFYRVGDVEAENPITLNILRNQAALMSWMMENAGISADEASQVVIENPPTSDPVVAEETTDEPTDEPGGKDCGCGCGCSCSCSCSCAPFDLCIPHLDCISSLDTDTGDVQFATLSIADLDEEQRLAVYATL